MKEEEGSSAYREQTGFAKNKTKEKKTKWQ